MENQDLSSLRTSGDIDVLLGDCNPTDEFISAVCKMAIENGTPHLHATYHHCDFGKVANTEVEAHWRASWFYTPWYNKRFQAFCQEHIEDKKGFAEKGFYDKNSFDNAQDKRPNPSVELDSAIALASNACTSENSSELDSSAAQSSSATKGLSNSTEAKNHAYGKNLSLENNSKQGDSSITGTVPVIEKNKEIPVPSLAFNRVYVLVHIYRHLFTEGIGLRQIIDYYMVLKASAQLKDESGKLKENLHSTNSGQAFWPQQKIETMQRLRELGMERFTAAVMWVLAESLKLNDECLLCKPCEKDGRFLLSEIMQSGNFGKTDKRYIRRKGESFLHYAFRKIIRNFHLFHFGPWEVICTPFWRLWHICWWMVRHNSPELPRHN